MNKPHITLRTYVIVFAALMVLLAATVAAALLPYHRWNIPGLGIAIALTIAFIKAILVVLYFMHVRISSRLTQIFVLAGLFWLGILITITLADYLSRPWLPMSSGWTAQPANTPKTHP